MRSTKLYVDLDESLKWWRLTRLIVLSFLDLTRIPWLRGEWMYFNGIDCRTQRPAIAAESAPQLPVVAKEKKVENTEEESRPITDKSARPITDKSGTSALHRL